MSHRLRRRVWLLVGLLLTTCGSVGCRQPDTPQGRGGDEKLNVVATVGMVADLVANVAGRAADVHQVMGPGIDPHLYKATRDDVVAIMSADVVFYSGLMLEGKMADTLLKIGKTKPVVAVAERIDVATRLADGDRVDHADPHLWMDVSAWEGILDVIVQTLSECSPDNAALFRDNADAYRRQMRSLHQFGIDAVATIPADRRILVTSHDAFGYFGRAYGLQVDGVQGLSTESEAGLQRINDLVDRLVRNKVPAVFIESSVPRKNIDALIEGARAKGHEVVVGGELYSDAMGPAGTYRGTYLGMLDHNLTVVTRGLGGSVDAGGWSGKLTRPDD